MFEVHCLINRELIGWLANGLDKLKVHQPQILQELLPKKFQQTIDFYQQNLTPNEAIANVDYYNNLLGCITTQVYSLAKEDLKIF